MESSGFKEKVITYLLILGLVLNLIFVYFDQERLYRSLTTGSLTLGAEKYIRILSVIFIFISVCLSLFSGKKKYSFSVFFSYLLLLFYVTANYLLSGGELFDMTQFMSNRGIGTWICLGLIFVSYDNNRYQKFKKFIFLSILFILILVCFNLISFGVGMWRGQALSKYQVYAVNLVWTAPYVFLILKHHEKYRWLRVVALSTGIIAALICQTRSFLIIYFLTLLFDFFNTKRKTNYTVLLFLSGIAFAYVVLNTTMLSSSVELLLNRGTDDTRTEQLSVFLRQLTPIELVTGSGFFASYGFGNNQWTAVDNQWLYLLWWGGLIPFICYFYLAAMIPIKLVLRGSLDYETKVECFVLLVWVLGLAGLAIQSTMSVDFFFFIISIMLGRVLHKYSFNKKYNLI